MLYLLALLSLAIPWMTLQVLFAPATNAAGIGEEQQARHHTGGTTAGISGHILACHGSDSTFAVMRSQKAA